MSMYEKLPEDARSTAGLYKKRGEAFEISKPILHENKKYFIIEYNKILLGLKTKSIQGRLVLDEQGKVIKDRTILREIGKLVYYYDAFFVNRGTDLRGALKSDEDIAKEINDYTDASAALEHLSSKEIYGAGEVRRIIEGFPGMKKEANDMLKAVMDKVKEYEIAGTPFSRAVMDDIFPFYEKALLMNFQRIKFINTASAYYDTVRDQAIKMRKSAGIRFDKKNKNTALKLEGILSFYINVLKFYGDFLNYSVDRYKQNMLDKDKKDIDEYIKSFRNFALE